MTDPVQSFLGFKLAHLIAGVSGGMVRALVKGESLKASIVSILIGALTAIHISPYILDWFHIESQNADLGFGFFVGVTAMFIAEGMMKRARTWSKNPTIPGGLND